MNRSYLFPVQFSHLVSILRYSFPVSVAEVVGILSYIKENGIYRYVSGLGHYSTPIHSDPVNIVKIKEILRI
jgi:hypothetical protein